MRTETRERSIGKAVIRGIDLIEKEQLLELNSEVAKGGAAKAWEEGNLMARGWRECWFYERASKVQDSRKAKLSDAVLTRKALAFELKARQYDPTTLV